MKDIQYIYDYLGLYYEFSQEYFYAAANPKSERFVLFSITYEADKFRFFSSLLDDMYFILSDNECYA